MERSDELLDLNKDELRVVRTVLKSKGIKFDKSKKSYTASELFGLGFVRENWSTDEILDKGFKDSGILTSFDENGIRAQRDLIVDAPFADGILKWQLPIPLQGLRVVMTRFPPNTVVKLHVHPNWDDVSRCGQLRVVVKGSITYSKQKYMPGDWFFIPNDTPYSFTTDPDMETLENYYYQYNGFTGLPMRFSYLRPIAEGEK
ncbi:cupin domain-containing protein [Sinorhizobium meliloti]|uniref:cupin domain-containing protein n=1 Tax=Rhizobium meliloti TaxID=382 RepID=UPI000FDB64C4|nr:cupin domain-containing protein [Sinorhizobium meliloti]RVG71055.1 hypothetical protein CN223_30475 [Sinorhizobium meliloti]